MKPSLLASIVLIVLGVVAIGYQGITYTAPGEAIDLGPIRITTERTHTIPLAQILGVIALGGGVALFIASRRAA